MHPERENPGYAYEKRAPPYIGMGPRMVNPALNISTVTCLNSVPNFSKIRQAAAELYYSTIFFRRAIHAVSVCRMLAEVYQICGDVGYPSQLKNPFSVCL